MSDFLEETTFKKGKGKTQTLPAHLKQAGEKVVAQFRCWDGLLGCEQYKPKEAFRFHTLICEDCALAITSRHDVERKDIDILALLIHQDASLVNSARVLGGDSKKIAALQEGATVHLPDLLRTMQRVWKDPQKVAFTNRTYRLWFYDEAGVDVAKSRAPAPGFAAMEPA